VPTDLVLIWPLPKQVFDTIGPGLDGLFVTAHKPQEVAQHDRLGFFGKSSR
jgi:hypothetical protein